MKTKRDIRKQRGRIRKGLWSRVKMTERMKAASIDDLADIVHASYTIRKKLESYTHMQKPCMFRYVLVVDVMGREFPVRFHNNKWFLEDKAHGDRDIMAAGWRVIPVDVFFERRRFHGVGHIRKREAVLQQQEEFAFGKEGE